MTVPASRHTSFVVLAVGAERFHGYMTAGPSPAWLADAVPSTGFQGAPSVVVAETWTTLWEEEGRKACACLRVQAGLNIKKLHHCPTHIFHFPMKLEGLIIKMLIPTFTEFLSKKKASET